MTNKTASLAVLTALFFLSQAMWAQSPAQQAQQAQQSSGSGRYVIEQRYLQQLVWIGDDYTLKYEVVIEQNDGVGASGGYKAYIREFTEKPNFLVSLPLGKYRYRIIPYDYLEQPGEASDWVYIEIKPAPIVSVKVQEADDGSYVLYPYENEQIVPGVNEIVIKNPDEKEQTTPAVDEAVIAAPDEKEQKAPIVEEIVIAAPEEKEQTAPVVEEIVTTTPDEPEIIREDETEKPLNLYASVAWAPIIPLYGRLQEIFGNEFYAEGGFVRFGALYNKLQWFSPGIELLMSWYALNNTDGSDKIGLQTGVMGINIVAQKKLPYPKMAITLRAGFALAFQIGEINIDQYSYTTGGIIPQVHAEASFLWVVYKQLYLEAGLGF